MKVQQVRSRARLGAWLWVSSLQYFLAQILTATAWRSPFSLVRNYISDLGNTSCAAFNGLPVCSPWHLAMNASFIALGTTMITGAWLMGGYLKPASLLRWGLWCIALAGVGTIAVGLCPENVDLAIHEAGACLPFVVGNVGMLLIASALLAKHEAGWRLLGGFSLLSGVVGSISAGLFFFKIYAGVGVGGMERLATYPLAIWMIVFGLSCTARIGTEIDKKIQPSHSKLKNQIQNPLQPPNNYL